MWPSASAPSATTFWLLSLVIVGNTGGPVHYAVHPATSRAVQEQVDRATRIATLPTNLEPSLARAPKDYGGWQIPRWCAATEAQASEGLCNFGDPHGGPLMVAYGDSHAVMWLPALAEIASAAHWRLIVLGKPYCPAEMVGVLSPKGLSAAGGRYRACDQWHQWAVSTINRLRPSLVIIAQENYYSPATPASGSGAFTPDAWRAGLFKLVEALDLPRSNIAFLGNLPVLTQSGPDCLATHTDDVQACSVSTKTAFFALDTVEQESARELGIRYVDVTHWFCSSRCTAVIGHFDVYVDRFHVSGTYTRYLEDVLGQSLGLFPTPGN